MTALPFKTVFSALLLSASLVFSPLSRAEAKAESVIVELGTNFGTIVLELFPEQAPITVENFLNYVEAGAYEGTIFHRVIPRFMIQGGGMDLELKPRPTNMPIRNEAGNGLQNLRGTIAMARTSNPHSATSQFFINHADNMFLNHGFRGGAGYAVFGRVIQGMSVVDSIAMVPTQPMRQHQNVPSKPVVIEKVSIRESAVLPDAVTIPQ